MKVMVMVYILFQYHVVQLYSTLCLYPTLSCYLWINGGIIWIVDVAAIPAYSFDPATTPDTRSPVSPTNVLSCSASLIFQHQMTKHLNNIYMYNHNEFVS